MTHFEAIISLLAVVIGWLSALVVGVWRARGWMDQRNSAENRLAAAIEELTRTQQEQHKQNQQRFGRIERRLSMPA